MKMQKINFYRYINISNGKLYPTEDLAAAAFGCIALRLTAADKRERGAIIVPKRIKVMDAASGQAKRIKVYTYGYIFTGGHNNVIIGVVLRFLLDLILPRRISFVHTHPYCTGHKPEAFSVGDELVAKLPGVNYMYLASPGGMLYKYDGKAHPRDKTGVLALKPLDCDLPKIDDRFDCRKISVPQRMTLKRYINGINSTF